MSFDFSGNPVPGNSFSICLCLVVETLKQWFPTGEGNSPSSGENFDIAWGGLI